MAALIENHRLLSAQTILGNRLTHKSERLLKAASNPKGLYRFLYASVHSGLFEVSQKAQSSESAYQSALSRIVQSIEPPKVCVRTIVDLSPCDLAFP